jgi:hypothetical protein
VLLVGLHHMIPGLLSVFVGGIIRGEAQRRGLPVIDLAAVFCDPLDYANPIEPGVLGKDA